jgi:hypothetical protein
VAELAEGGRLLTCYTGLNPYREFESRPFRAKILFKSRSARKRKIPPNGGGISPSPIKLPNNMDIIQEAKQYALEEISKTGLPGMIGFELSEKKALELADVLHADKTITHLGALLMDLKLGKAMQENRLKDHVAMSAEATKEFLMKYSLPNKTKENILNCVMAHHGAIPYNCVEAEICANADCYRFIHPKGVFDYFSVLGQRGLNFDQRSNQVESKMDEKYNILTLDICKKELEPYYRTFKQYIKDAREF